MSAHKSLFLRILIGLGVVSGLIIYFATRPGAIKPPTLASIVPSHQWGEEKQPVIAPVTKQSPAAQATTVITKTPPPLCEPCKERWDRYRTAIETGLGRDNDYRMREIPQMVAR